VLGGLRNVTVSQAGGKWFASIQTQREVERPLPTATSAIGIDLGIDLGIARFASDGSHVAALHSFKKHEKLSPGISGAWRARPIQQQLEEGQGPRPEDSPRHRPRPQRLPAQSPDLDGSFPETAP
jgi:hypothetical protein